jgi:hypothetical protein
MERSYVFAEVGAYDLELPEEGCSTFGVRMMHKTDPPKGTVAFLSCGKGITISIDGDTLPYNSVACNQPIKTVHVTITEIDNPIEIVAMYGI